MTHHNDKKLIIGNWKMHKSLDQTVAFFNEFLDKVNANETNSTWVIAPPFTSLGISKVDKKFSNLHLAAQNVAHRDEGAYTGEISLPMLENLEVKYVLIGHSERRKYFNESDESVNLKLINVLTNSSITPILIFGEPLKEYEAKNAKNYVKFQLQKCLAHVKKEEAKSIVFAYEPIWAIGTGKVPTMSEIKHIFEYIRGVLSSIYDDSIAKTAIILYGGSVNSTNVKEILGSDLINGALVGGSSLKVDEFISLLNWNKK